eukprot:403357782
MKQTISAGSQQNLANSRNTGIQLQSRSYASEIEGGNKSSSSIIATPTQNSMYISQTTPNQLQIIDTSKIPQQAAPQNQSSSISTSQYQKSDVQASNSKQQRDEQNQAATGNDLLIPPSKAANQNTISFAPDSNFNNGNRESHSFNYKKKRSKKYFVEQKEQYNNQNATSQNALHHQHQNYHHHHHSSSNSFIEAGISQGPQNTSNQQQTPYMGPHHHSQLSQPQLLNQVSSTSIDAQNIHSGSLKQTRKKIPRNVNNNSSANNNNQVDSQQQQQPMRKVIHFTLTEEDLDDKPEQINKSGLYSYFDDSNVDVILQENGDGLMNSYINQGEQAMNQGFNTNTGVGGFFNHNNMFGGGPQSEYSLLSHSSGISTSAGNTFPYLGGNDMMGQPMYFERPWHKTMGGGQPHSMQQHYGAQDLSGDMTNISHREGNQSFSHQDLQQQLNDKNDSHSNIQYQQQQQMQRQSPDISDWFNFGFNEETFVCFINQQIKSNFDKNMAQRMTALAQNKHGNEGAFGAMLGFGGFHGGAGGGGGLPTSAQHHHHSFFRAFNPSNFNTGGMSLMMGPSSASLYSMGNPKSEYSVS